MDIVQVCGNCVRTAKSGGEERDKLVCLVIGVYADRYDLSCEKFKELTY